jgi:trans-aconitate methyltransferase
MENEKLLSEKELIWSAVVANSTMNRARNASGLNSYEKEFGFQPEQFLQQHIAQFGFVKWLDLCCGEGKALVQSALYLADNNLQQHAQLKGIDLIDGFQPVPDSVSCLQWEVKSLIDWEPKDKYDLITCVHGLHYVGDRLLVLKKALQSLTEHGMLIVNIDLRNIRVSSDKYLKEKLKQEGITYNAQRRILKCIGPREIEWGLQYKGADDKAGPNYTGQEAVDAYYSI